MVAVGLSLLTVVYLSTILHQTVHYFQTQLGLFLFFLLKEHDRILKEIAGDRDMQKVMRLHTEHIGDEASGNDKLCQSTPTSGQMPPAAAVSSPASEDVCLLQVRTA